MASIARPAEITGAPAGWLRGASFDLSFILGIAALGLASGLVVANDPRLFGIVLVADLWFLGYHHVIATYTRLCFDGESFREHRFLVLGLPFLVFAGVALAAWGVGLWTLATVYFYWQWFHYARQSFGISRIYDRKAGVPQDPNPRLSQVIFWLVPLWGIMSRSEQDPGTFLEIELRVLPVPEFAVDAVGLLAAAGLVCWTCQRVMLWRRGRLSVAHTLYMLTHFLIFFVGYIAVENINYGWLVLNVWHNAQYIAFVWIFNNNRFRAGVDPKARFLSTLSQSRNGWAYLVVCFGLSTIVYLAIANLVAAFAVLIIIYQTINFHHYIVDGLIWKVRRKPLQQTLGIAG